MNDVPIYKVGVCAIMQPAHGEPEVLLVQPKGKDPSQRGAPPFVLPRGTRAYQAADGSWQDARSAEAAREHAAHLEPLEDTMKREALEEAGIPASLFAMRPYKTLGARIYASPTKPPYPVHWGVLTLQPEDNALLQPPADSQAMKWVTLSQMEAMVQDGTARAGYLDIAREALDLLARGKGGNGR